MHENSGINIKDLFITFWAYKYFIVFVTFLFFIFGIIFLMKQEKIYMATGTFFLEDKGQTSDFGSMVSSKLGGLAAISALPGFGKSSTDALIERITEREFVLEISRDLKLHNDKFFNNFDPSSPDPSWKKFVRSVLGLEDGNLDPEKIAEWRVVESFKSAVTISSSEAGAIIVNARHTDPKRTAEIANYIVNKTINLIKNESLLHARERIDYLSKFLADASLKFDETQETIKQFALKNSTQASQSFFAGSVILDDLRLKREKGEIQVKTIEALKEVIINKQADYQHYLLLQKKYPLLDQAEFRRILGVPELISTWSWPNIQTLSRVQDSIFDRNAALEVEIKKLEKEALRYAESAAELTKLKRDLKIAESTYNVLNEQVKSSSLVAGFTPDRSKILAIAEIPLRPYYPSIFIILATSSILGTFVGLAISWVLGSRRGVLYSNASLLLAFNCGFNHKIGSVSNYDGKTLENLQTYQNKSPLVWPKQVFLEILNDHETNFFISLDTTQSNNASTIARILVANAALYGKQCALINLSRKVRPDVTKVDLGKDAELKVLDSVDGCTEYTLTNDQRNIEWIFSKSFDHTLQRLLDGFDIVMLCADFNDFEIIYSAQIIEKAKVIAYASAGNTTKNLIERIKRQGKIEVVLYA